MVTYVVTNGPTTDSIFAAARYATTPKWRTPLEFTINKERVSFNWVNEITWMGERSKYLSFAVMLHGHKFIVRDYDTNERSGELSSAETGRRSVDLLVLIASKRDAALGASQWPT